MKHRNRIITSSVSCVFAMLLISCDRDHFTAVAPPDASGSSGIHARAGDAIVGVAAESIALRIAFREAREGDPANLWALKGATDSELARERLPNSQVGVTSAGLANSEVAEDDGLFDPAVIYVARSLATAPDFDYAGSNTGRGDAVAYTRYFGDQARHLMNIESTGYDRFNDRIDLSGLGQNVCGGFFCRVWAFTTDIPLYDMPRCGVQLRLRTDHFAWRRASSYLHWGDTAAISEGHSNDVSCTTADNGGGGGGGFPTGMPNLPGLTCRVVDGTLEYWAGNHYETVYSGSITICTDTV